MKLSREYYAGGDTRIEGMNSKGWWFTGGSSFMSNGYVIYTNGLDGWLPNPNAILQGRTYDFRLFDARSMDQRASYFKFITQLQQIVDKAAANEEAYLKMKLDQLSSSDIDVNYLDKIKMAVEQKEYSAAYTLLLKRDKDIQEFAREINSNKNQSFSKTNEFFNSQFYQYLANKLEKQLETQSDTRRSINYEEDFESFVDGFFKEVLNVSLADNQSLQYIHDQLIDGLKKVSDSEDKFTIKWATILDSPEAKLKNWKGNTHKFKRDLIVTKGSGFRTPKQLAEKIAYDLIGSIGRGLSGEVYQIGSFEGIGAHAYSTGHELQERINYFGESLGMKQGKNDIRVFDASLPIDSVIQEMYGEGYDETQQDFYNELARRLKFIADTTGAGDFFEIAVNVKSYLSNFDLSIEGEGTFANRMGVINRLPLEGGMADKLVFMLNNTTEDCIMAGRQDEIADYLAVVCAAWMWDNVDEMFDINAVTPSNYHKIYLFNSGGAYFTSSQIIQQTIDRLLGDNDAGKFVNVTINPPSSYSGYDALIDQYPGTGITNKDEWDKMLQQMWEVVKADAMNSGTLAIHFNQAALNDLLSGLGTIVNS